MGGCAVIEYVSSVHKKGVQVVIKVNENNTAPNTLACFKNPCWILIALDHS